MVQVYNNIDSAEGGHIGDKNSESPEGDVLRIQWTAYYTFLLHMQASVLSPTICNIIGLSASLAIFEALKKCADEWKVIFL